MGGFEGNPYPAFQTLITGIDTPFAEGGTALLRCSSLRFFFYRYPCLLPAHAG